MKEAGLHLEHVNGHQEFDRSINAKSTICIWYQATGPGWVKTVLYFSPTSSL
jgi:hypothetical protein